MASPAEKRLAQLEEENSRLRLELQAARAVPPLPIAPGGLPVALPVAAPAARSPPLRSRTKAPRKRGGKQKEDFGTLCLRYKARYERLRTRYKKAAKMGCPFRDFTFPDYVHCEVRSDLQAAIARLDEAARVVDSALAVARAKQSAPVPDLDAVSEFPGLPRPKRKGRAVVAPTAAVDHSQDVWGGLVQGLGDKKWAEYVE